MLILLILELISSIDCFKKTCLYEFDDKKFDLSDLQREQGWIIEQKDGKGILRHNIHFSFCQSNQNKQCDKQNGNIQSYYDIIVRDQVKQECFVLGYYDSQFISQNYGTFSLNYEGDECVNVQNNGKSMDIVPYKISFNFVCDYNAQTPQFDYDEKDHCNKVITVFHKSGCNINNRYDNQVVQRLACIMAALIGYFAFQLCKTLQIFQTRNLCWHFIKSNYKAVKKYFNRKSKRSPFTQL